jgi:hypothetical protein
METWLWSAGGRLAVFIISSHSEMRYLASQLGDGVQTHGLYVLKETNQGFGLLQVFCQPIGWVWQ